MSAAATFWFEAPVQQRQWAIEQAIACGVSPEAYMHVADLVVLAQQIHYALRPADPAPEPAVERVIPPALGDLDLTPEQEAVYRANWVDPVNIKTSGWRDEQGLS